MDNDLLKMFDPKRRGDSPVSYVTSEVPLRGEPLHPIFWRGRQWAVTTYGIECLDGHYHIDADSLFQGFNVGDRWPTHMSEKNWVDLDDFITAWLIALTLHGVNANKDLVWKAITDIPVYED